MSAHRWKVLGVGFAANASFAAIFAGLPATSVLMRASYGVDTRAVGTAFSAMGLGIALSELPWGLLTDRLGDRRVLLGGLTLTTALLVCMTLWLAPGAPPASSWSGLVIALGLVGLAGGSVNGSSGRAVMTWFDSHERGLAMSIRQTAVPVGGAIGALALPAVVGERGFEAGFAVLAVFCALCAAFTYAWLHEPRAMSSRTAPTDAGENRVPSVLRQFRIWQMVAGIGLLCVPQVAALGFTALFLHDIGHFGVGQTTAAIVIFQVLAAGLRVWSGHWTDRHRNRRAFLRFCSGLAALIFLGLGGLAFAADRAQCSGPLVHALLAVAITAGGAVGSCWHGVAFTELAIQAGPRRVGAALGLGNTFAFLTYFLTTLTVPALVAIQGWPLAWVLVALCALAAAPLLSGRAAAPGTSKTAKLKPTA